MKLHWVDLAFVFALVAAGFAIGAFVRLRKLRQIVADHRRQIASLTELVWALEARMTEFDIASVAPAEPAASALEPAQPQNDAISPEIQAVIAAAAVTLFGHKVRLRATRLVSSQAGVSSWTQQGRVTVQTSHNLRPRR